MAMIRNDEFYSRIKIASLVLFIPLTLTTGPLVGYFIGRYLEHSPLVLFISTAAGFIISFKATARIIRMILKINKDIERKQIANKFSKEETCPK